MIRLALEGDEGARRALDGRLAGATLVAAAGGGDLPAGDVDAVLWLEPSPGDVETVQQLLASGIHVLLTARSWLSGATLDALAAAAQSGGAQLVVENAHRYLPSRRAIRQQLDTGRLGTPGLVRSHRWLPTNHADSGHLPSALTQDIDITRWLMGTAPEVVYAVQGEGTIQLHLGFAGGGMALLDYTDQLPEGDGYCSLSLIGSTGAAYADDHQNVQLVYRGGRPTAMFVGERAAQLAGLAQWFVSGLRKAQDLSSGLTGWRRAVTVAETAQRSAAERCALTMKEP